LSEAVRRRAGNRCEYCHLPQGAFRRGFHTEHVSNEGGEPTAVIVPIFLWREIESERETAYLLKSEAMKRRLLRAKQRQQGLSLDQAVQKLGI